MGKRTIKARDGISAVTLGNNVAKVSSNEENYVIVNEKGTNIAGPIGIPAGSAQMRFGPLWRMNSEMAMMIPSTTATPTPVMMFDLPIKDYVTLMTSSMGMMALSGIQSA